MTGGPPVPLIRALRLHLAGVTAGRSLLAATFAWFLVLGATYAADAGPPLAAAAFTAAALLPVSAWAASAVLATASDDLRAVLTAADGRGRVLVLDALVPLLWVLAAAVVGVLAGVFFDPHPAPVTDRIVALAVHVCCGAVGVALALLLHAGKLRPGTQVLVVVAVTVASGRLAWLPPAGPVLSVWGTGRPASAGAAVWSFAGPVAVAALLLVAAALVRRRRV